MTTATSYSTQAAAERDARTAIWGDVPFARRAYVAAHPAGNDPLGVVALGSWGVHELPMIAVSATVNGRLVVFTFDSYGRRDQPPLVLSR